MTAGSIVLLRSLSLPPPPPIIYLYAQLDLLLLLVVSRLDPARHRLKLPLRLLRVAARPLGPLASESASSTSREFLRPSRASLPGRGRGAGGRACGHEAPYIYYRYSYFYVFTSTRGPRVLLVRWVDAADLHVWTTYGSKDTAGTVSVLRGAGDGGDWMMASSPRAALTV